MPDDNFEDFEEVWRKSQADGLLDPAPRNLHDHCVRFVTAANNNPDQQCAALLQLLGSVCSLQLDSKSIHRPLTCLYRFENLRSCEIDDFTPDDLKLLNLALRKCSKPQMVARIGDVLWIRCRDHQAALKAIDAYMQSTNVSRENGYTYERLTELERGCVLSLQLGKNHEAMNRTLDILESHIAAQTIDCAPAYFCGLLEIRLRFPGRIPDTTIQLAEEVACRIKTNGAEILLRNFLDMLCSLYRRNKNDAKLKSTIREVSESYLRESDSHSSAQPPDFLLASTFLDRAIHTLRRLPEAHDEVELLKKRLMDFQSKSIHQFGAFSTPYDVSEIVKETEEVMSGKQTVDALLALAVIGGLPPKKMIEDQLKESIRLHPLSNMVPHAKMNSRGRVVAKSGPLLFGDSQKSSEAFHSRLVQEVEMYRQVSVSSRIAPALHVFLVEHSLVERDLMSLLSVSPFVPPGRETLFCKGLMHGLNQELVDAVHLLYPQVEAAIRYYLEARGHVVTKIDENGLQKEYDLSHLLYRPELAQYFGEDIVFHLQALLVEKMGPNLRNCAAHGLLEAHEFYSADSLFFWWLCLFLCLAPLANTS
ncbi:MAG: DUF4209 domain-containing protein [candidate division Zixibacteria bacterium]|nr:DUF4209 domain-containing protein [candidate division Zixibacteria bacterium]